MNGNYCIWNAKSYYYSPKMNDSIGICLWPGNTMIQKLWVQNFKSIRDITLDCKRVNLFIGEPNTGKSNILESLGFLSWCARPDTNLKYFVRFQNMYNLFYDNLIDNPCSITLWSLHEPSVPYKVKIFYSDNFFIIDTQLMNQNEKKVATVYPAGIVAGSDPHSAKKELEYIKYYHYTNRSDYPDQSGSYLVPPDGPNLFTLVMSNARLRETMKGFFTDYDLKIVFKPVEMTFEVQKEREDLIFNYPYPLLSDTLRRIIFYTIAIESNGESTIVFEEPESHAFPYYTKWLGEKIARDTKNQYFIATHNPYLLQAIMEKTTTTDLSVWVTYYRNYQTRVHVLTQNQIEEAMSMDPFFNISAFIPDKE
ncbi:MAG: AAA family ATPase [Methanoregulaceae archaeon]|jgi:hypothetical protein